MGGIVVRVAEPSEYGRVGALTIAAYRALPVDHLWGGYGDEILDVAGRAQDAEILVACDGDLVVGAVTLVSDPRSRWREWTEDDEVQFRLLAVDPSARGRGIGEAIVRECLTRAGIRPVLIHTTKWLEAAQRLYGRLGFVRQPARDVPYETWYDPKRDHDLPPEWLDEQFLAYGRSGEGPASVRTRGRRDDRPGRA